MDSVQHLGWFIVAGLLLNLTPGPDVLFVVRQGLRHGAKAGAMAAAGITAGCSVHIVAAAVGVSALIAASATAFAVLKYVGAAYLVYMGLRLLFTRGTPKALTLDGADQSAPTLRSVFLQGFATNALNPKVALFFLAFVPQFIAPGATHTSMAFLWLGVLFNFNGFFVNLAYGLLAAWAAARLTLLHTLMVWLDRVAGLLFTGFGLRLAFATHAD